MREVDIRRIDLNLLVVLRVLLDTGSVTRTAERLHMSQPAVSRALAKLRLQLGDKLLVRVAGGMTPTLRAQSLSAPLAALLHQLEEFVAPAVFNPATTRRVFRVATTDYGAVAVLPSLMQAFAQLAPLAGIEVIPFSDAVFELLNAGQVDFILYSDDPVAGTLRTRPLFRETYSCLLRAGHPLLVNRDARADQALSLQEFTAWPHALVSIFGGRTGEVDDALAACLQKRHIALWLPYFATAGLVSAASDLIVTLPTRVATALAATNGLRLLKPPLALSGFGYRMLWHERSHEDPGCVWLRDLVAATANHQDAADTAAFT